MTTRRQVVLVGALGALGALSAFAQGRVPRIGVLSGRPLAESFYARPLVKELAELGYRDGAGAILEYRSTDGFADRYPKHARELVDLKCDVIFAVGSEHPVRAMMKLGTPVPTVFWAGDYDPVERGIVRNLGRPEGNITGVYAPQSLLVANPINRYLINSPMLPQLVKDPDGGITLYIQNESPGKDKEPNWLPCPPSGSFNLSVRSYQPKESWLDGSFVLPPVRKVS